MIHVGRIDRIDPREIRASQWAKGPRVRIDTLRRGQRFLDIEGTAWTYDRIDGALSGVHHVHNVKGASCFAGCAEVLLTS